MNNWRLLLLAVVAVFQPIATFTERNFVDGRQQCCDPKPTTSTRDTKSSLHGHRYTETTSPLRLLSDRIEIREDRRYELRQRESLLSRLSTERPLRDIKERAVRQSPIEIARTTRVESHFERSANDYNRGRVLEVYDREKTYRNRKIVERRTRDAEDRRNTRANHESLRFALTRKENGVSRFSDERLSKDICSPHVEMKVERLSVARRESSAWLNARRNIEYNERQQEQHGDQRRTASGNHRLINRIRLNARDDNKENRHPISATQRPSIERFEQSHKIENFRHSEKTRENVNRIFDLERIQVARKNDEESRIRDVTARYDKRESINHRRMSQHVERRGNPESNIKRSQVEGRREVRDERMSRDARFVSRANAESLSHNSLKMDRINSRDSRIKNTLNDRNDDNRRDIKVERMTRDIIPNKRENTDRRMSRERFVVERRNANEVRPINARNIDERRALRDERISRGVRENTERQVSRENLQLERRITREASIRNILTEMNVDDRREARDVRMSLDDRADKIDKTDRRISRERLQLERKNSREASIRNLLTERDVDDHREAREVKISPDVRAVKRENSDRRVSREKLHMERRDTREVSIRNNLNERNVDDRREVRNARMSRETVENTNRRISRDRSQVERKETRESRLINTLNERKDHSRREVRYESMARDVRMEGREKTDRRMSREHSERKNNRERIINNLNKRNIDNEREVRDERIPRDISTNKIQNTDRRIARQRLQVERRNTLEARNMNHVLNDRNEIRAEMITRDVRADNRENTDRRMSCGRQMERRNSNEARITHTLNDRNVDDRREVRDERMVREARAASQENTDRRISRERVQVEQRNDRASKIMDTRNEREIVSRREVREERLTEDAKVDSRENTKRPLNREDRRMDKRSIRVPNNSEITQNESLSRQIRADQLTRERRSESRLNRAVAAERGNLRSDRGARTVDRQNFREIRAESIITRSPNQVRKENAFGRIGSREKSENREREDIVARSRNAKTITSMNGNTEIEESIIGTWQYLLYSLQGAYLCALFIQMMTPSFLQKDKMMTRWLPVSSYYNPTKVD